MYEYKAVVTRVIDGDTVELAVDLGFAITINEKFRLLGVDTPEMPTPEGKSAKAAVEVKLLNKTITVRSEGKDKYGRYLATLFLNGENINRWLLEKGTAFTYSPELHKKLMADKNK